MIWSKLKKRFVNLHATSVKERVAFHTTRYNLASGGYSGKSVREWVTFDGFTILKNNMWNIRFDICDIYSCIQEYINMSFEEILKSKENELLAFSFLDKIVS